jgi:carbonic anhydrase
MKNKTYDLVGFAGSTKSLPTIMKQVKISKSLHHISHVVLIHHEECGAYGAESTPQRHAEDLNKAKKRILRLYPDLQVTLLYLLLNGEFENVK